MSKKNGMMAKIGILYSFIFSSFLMCGLPIFVMQAVSVFHQSHSSAFVCMKKTIYSSIALETSDKKCHASFMSILEGVFMGGMMVGMWIFSGFMKGNWLHAFWVFAIIGVTNALYWFFVNFDESEIEKAKEQSFRDSFKGG